MQFGVACNLRCIMCNHPQRYAGGENQELSADAMLRMAEYLKLAESVHIIGGEPLIIPNAVRFLEGVLTRPELWDLRYVIYTNAQPLDEFTEKLLPLERLVITASIDSSGDYYDAIRVRSSWKQVTRNLERFMQTGRQHGKQWSVYISIVLMKSGLLGLPELISWCIANGFPANIVNIGDLEGKRNDTEHIFRNPALLQEIPGWEAALDKSIALFYKAGRQTEARRLEQTVSELTQALSEEEKKRGRRVSFGEPIAWEPLFGGAAEPLIEQLHQYLYGRRKNENAVAKEPEGFKFTPTLALDHIATDFMEAGTSDLGGKRWLRLQYKWAYPDAQKCIVDLQDEQCHVLEPWELRADNTAGSEVSAVFDLPSGVQRVRIRLTLPSLEAGYLPDEMRLERAIPAASLVAIDGLPVKRALLSRFFVGRRQHP